jgi:hypothetical protein
MKLTTFFRLGSLLVLLSLSIALRAQSDPPGTRYQLFGGYSFLSNSFNGVLGSQQSLNGWDTSIAIPPWHHLSFKGDIYGYRGTNIGAKQNSYFILGGGQYGRRFGREFLYIEGLMGEGGITRYWGPNGLPGGTASFATLMGGGIDTPLAKHFSFRVDGDYQWSNFTLITNVSRSAMPYIYPGLPNNFARFSSGLVWKF